MPLPFVLSGELLLLFFLLVGLFAAAAVVGVAVAVGLSILTLRLLLAFSAWLLPLLQVLPCNYYCQNHYNTTVVMFLAIAALRGC